MSIASRACRHAVRSWLWVLVGISWVCTPGWASEAPYLFNYPAPVLLKYEAEGQVRFRFSGQAELLWQHDGQSYVSRLAVRKFGVNLQIWNSKGKLTSEGLAPDRFGSSTRKDVTATFMRDKGVVVFSAETPQVPLEPGAQDQLSAYMQLAGLLSGDPTRWTTGKTISMQAIGDRYSENWIFVTGASERVKLLSGDTIAVKFTRLANAESDQKVEIWYAPSKAYIPIRIRISQPNGDFIDMLWAESIKP